MNFAIDIVCARCEKLFSLEQLLNLCTCGSPLLVRYDLPKAAVSLDKLALAGRPPTLWRYRELLPLQHDANLISLAEGFTPLVEANTLARELRLNRLWIKDE